MDGAVQVVRSEDVDIQVCTLDYDVTPYDIQKGVDTPHLYKDIDGEDVRFSAVPVDEVDDYCKDLQKQHDERH